MVSVYELTDIDEVTNLWRHKNASELKKLLGESKLPDVVLATICIQAIIATFGVVANLIVIVVTILGRSKQVSNNSIVSREQQQYCKQQQSSA